MAFFSCRIAQSRNCENLLSVYSPLMITQAKSGMNVAGRCVAVGNGDPAGMSGGILLVAIVWTATPTP
jgi:hypothetical protein